MDFMYFHDQLMLLCIERRSREVSDSRVWHGGSPVLLSAAFVISANGRYRCRPNCLSPRIHRTQYETRASSAYRCRHDRCALKSRATEPSNVRTFSGQAKKQLRRPKRFWVEQDDLWVPAKHSWVERHILGWRKTSLGGAKTFLGEARKHFGARRPG